jgi:hypothetical protein
MRLDRHGDAREDRLEPIRDGQRRRGRATAGSLSCLDGDVQRSRELDRRKSGLHGIGLRFG